MTTTTLPTYSLHHGDVLNVLRTIPDRSVDHIVTDPPYCSGAITETAKSKAKSQGIASKQERRAGFQWFTGDAMTTNGFVTLLRSVAVEALRILRDGGHMLVFCDWRMYPQAAGSLESAGLRLQNMIVWDKGSPGMGNGFRPQHELIASLVKGTGRYHSHMGRNVLSAKRIPGIKKIHPTEKPVPLFSELLNIIAKPGDTICDPFTGSGPTGEAALRHGCHFIGIEREAPFIATATGRLERTLQELTP